MSQSWSKWFVEKIKLIRGNGLPPIKLFQHFPFSSPLMKQPKNSTSPNSLSLRKKPCGIHSFPTFVCFLWLSSWLCFWETSLNDPSSSISLFSFLNWSTLSILLRPFMSSFHYQIHTYRVNRWHRYT